MKVTAWPQNKNIKKKKWGSFFYLLRLTVISDKVVPVWNIKIKVQYTDGYIMTKCLFTWTDYGQSYFLHLFRVLAGVFIKWGSERWLASLFGNMLEVGDPLH